ncbi:MAG: hypothetical protein HYY18_20010 [Planctomycetes bacterium]|nr:hypothetical protein [Planctomycetota bacterium]
MKIAVAGLFVFMTAGLVFSAWTVVDLRRQVQDLETKVSAIADRPAAEPAASAPKSIASGISAAAGAPSDAAAGTIFDAGTADSPVARKPESTAPAGTDGSVASRLGPPETWTETERASFEKEVLAVLEKQRNEQEAKRDERQQEWMVARLSEKLKLTEAQAQAIGKIVNDTSTAVRTLRDTITPENREEVRGQIQQTVQAADTQVKSYLTAEQVTSYDELKKQQGGLLGFGGGGRNRGPGGDRPKVGDGDGQ